jgi:antitoxin (DNA-binding transcriptional repressor) of toxin-antitoxin stability system
MPVFTVHQAKTQLSQLIARAEAGEEIIIAAARTRSCG